MNNNIIEAGDTVNVYFYTTVAEFDLLIIHTPANMGECYHCVRNNGTPVNIMNFDKMELVSKKE